MVTPRRSAQPRLVRAEELVKNDPLLGEVVRRLVAELRPERIYLFGSRARGDATEDSDYDFMVVVEERVGPSYEMERRAHDALWGLPLSKDIVVVTRDRFDWLLGATASLPSTVAREGRLVYAR